MRKILTAALGILCGIAIIVMAFQFKTAAEIETDSLGMDVLHAGSATPTQVEDLYTGSYEWDKYYGGDAYSGIQQAAAQAANNVLALEDAINQTNEDLVAINKSTGTYRYYLRYLRLLLSRAGQKNSRLGGLNRFDLL